MITINNTDIFYFCSNFYYLGRTFDLEIFHHDHGIAIIDGMAICIRSTKGVNFFQMVFFWPFLCALWTYIKITIFIDVI